MIELKFIAEHVKKLIKLFESIKMINKYEKYPGFTSEICIILGKCYDSV